MSGPATMGWCPGALRPMEGGDGLIVRVKPSGGRLTLDAAERVAALASRDGNGRLDLTSRANLQIRGVAPATLPRLTDGLRELGLLDRDAATEAARNIVVSPLAGLDRDAHDVWPVVRALERRLADDPVLRRLHAKWSFAVDDGGALPLTGVGADVRILLGRDGRARLRLDGVAGEALLAPEDVPDRVSAVGRLAAEARAPARMRDLAAELGPGLHGRLGLTWVPRGAERPPVTPADLLGTHAGFVGFAPAFGGVSAPDLGAAARALRGAGCREVRLTPWRTMLAPVAPDAAAALAPLLARRFIVRHEDPRLAVSACVGAPGCRRATTPTRFHAARLARQGAPPVHVAGCGKGCGQTGAAAWTLVGRDGRYDVVAGGTARDRAVARGLSFPEAAAWISRAGHARTA